MTGDLANAHEMSNAAFPRQTKATDGFGLNDPPANNGSALFYSLAQAATGRDDVYEICRVIIGVEPRGYAQQ